MLGDEIKELLYKAVEFLNENLSSSEKLFNMLTTVILQLLATLVLFLIVRFCFWNKVTAMIETRKAKIEESLKQKDEALATLDATLKEAQTVKDESKKQASAIIENAKKQSVSEATAIINDAHRQIELEKKNALDSIEHQRKEMEKTIKNEIVDVALEKIVEHEVSKEENIEIINQTLSDLDKHK